MSRPLVRIALTSLAVSIGSFLAATAIFVTEPAGADPLSRVFDWDGNRKRCVNELGDAGERLTTREFTWDGSDEIHLSVPGELHYRPGAGNMVEARGPAYLLAHLEIEDGDVEYDCSPRGGAPRIEIDMRADGVREFSIRGSGDMFLEDLDEARIDISIAGSGSVTANGEVGRLSLSIAGSGDAHLGELNVRDMEIAIAGSGDATVSPRGSLEVFIAGSGDVDLLTNPDEVETSIMGSGRIRRPNSSSEPL